MGGKSWEKEFMEKHPIVSQLVINVLSSFIIGYLAGQAGGKNWAKENMPPKPIATIESLGQAKEVTITNEGIIPANMNYTLVSPESSINIEPKQGAEYLTVVSTSDNKIKVLNVNNLPKGEKIRVSVMGSNKVELKKGYGGVSPLICPSLEKNNKQ